mgnify:CR=1 FL=1
MDSIQFHKFVGHTGDEITLILNVNGELKLVKFYEGELLNRPVSYDESWEYAYDGQDKNGTRYEAVASFLGSDETNLEFEDITDFTISTQSENFVAESGIEILPKDHKQVFVNAKLGVEEGITENMADRIQIIKHSDEVEAPTQPEVKPQTIPSRREKPWRVPVIKPQPKATR